MISKETGLVLVVFLFLAGLSSWLQVMVQDSAAVSVDESDRDDPDYYLENFVSVGMDEHGQQYRLEAERLVHYSQSDRALLNYPHVTQYDDKRTSRHIYADSGWLYNNRSDMLLTGNIRVVQGQSSQGRGMIAAGDKMYVRLKPMR